MISGGKQRTAIPNTSLDLIKEEQSRTTLKLGTMSAEEGVYLNTKKHKASQEELENKKKKSKANESEPYDFRGGMLSSWHKLPFEVNGITYQTMEHWFQSQKFPEDPALQNQIRQASTPNLAKKLGQQPDKIRSDWFTVREDGGSVREDVMYEGLLAKFSQHPKLLKKLKSTGERLIRENSKGWGDEFWGIGSSGMGANKMGLLLMKVRDELELN